MEPLKEEAAIAKEYKQLSKEMEQSDVIVTVSDIDHYTEDNQRLDERLNHLKSQQAEKKVNKLKSISYYNDIKVNANKTIMTLKS